MLTQIVRAMFRAVWIKRAQYFRPSAYLRRVSGCLVENVLPGLPLVCGRASER